MCWLSIWIFLRESFGFSESVVAPCQFGSCHRKEFRLLSKYLDASALETRCPGGHSHVRIQGKFTKDSAVYTPALAKHIARAFAVALRQKASREADCCQVKGLESVIANDLLMTGEWKVEKVWDWDRPSHINLLESHAYLQSSETVCLLEETADSHLYSTPELQKAPMRKGAHQQKPLAHHCDVELHIKSRGVSIRHLDLPQLV